MKNHGKVHSSIEPQATEITGSAVFIASNVQPYEEEVDGRILSGYEYDCVEYTKDEYLALQSTQIASLAEELAAAKILLGVD